jgi:predicted ferric reductase
MTTEVSPSIALERKVRKIGGGSGLIGYGLVALAVAIPLFIYFIAAPGLSSRGTWFVVGEVTGIAGATLLAITVILASRLALLEWLFGDMTQVYVAHGVVGMLMFVVISVHPMLYFFGTLPAGADSAAHVIVPFHLVVLDWISYLAIATALITTLYMRLPFDRWRWIHLLLGLAVILTGYSILIDNALFDTAAIPALRIYLFVLFGASLASFVWVALVRRYVEPKHEYRIVSVEHHPHAQAVEVVAEPVGRPISFSAGQFAYADLVDDPMHIHRDFTAHPFSIASPPSQEQITMVIQAVGGHTERLQRIAASDDPRALLHGSFGRLVTERPRLRKQLWLAGGIGITPFLAMAADLAENPEHYEGYEVTLVLGVDSREQAFKLEQLEEHAERFPGLDVHLWVSEERGRPTIEGVAELLDGDLRDRAVMISGPEGMISNFVEQLEHAGVPRGQIRAERSIGPPGDWRHASPALRYMRFALTAFFAIFATAAIASTVGRAIS